MSTLGSSAPASPRSPRFSALTPSLKSPRRASPMQDEVLTPTAGCRLQNPAPPKLVRIRSCLHLLYHQASQQRLPYTQNRPASFSSPSRAFLVTFSFPEAPIFLSVCVLYDRPRRLPFTADAPGLSRPHCFPFSEGLPQGTSLWTTRTPSTSVKSYLFPRYLVLPLGRHSCGARARLHAVPPPPEASTAP